MADKRGLRLLRSEDAAPSPPVTDDAGPFLGAVELLPGNIQVALINSAGQVLQRVVANFARDAEVAEIEHILQAATTECFAGQLPTGIGVACGGLVDADAGILTEMHEVPALHGFAVVASLRSAVGVPVFLEHRARLQVLGDRWFGAGRGESSFASVSTGETLGVGVLYRGQVLAPDGGRSGAHMTVDRGGLTCTCGAQGCWKTLATSPWLRRRADQAGLGPAGSLLSVAQAAAEGHQVAREIIVEYAENVALGLVNIQQLCAPALFILHGEAHLGGELFRATIEQRLRVVDAQTTSPQPPRVRIADTDADDVALLGGAGLVLSEGLGN